ncbi:hypothetical protein NBZ79_17505 [Sneathiella marina]|uniref:Uncharacterized protein n=1 Tax=Sneathiella marina TaxID=2950108 RepID=A0ABY4W170_9PROT|nr:hypothetical protein [Sneathiella marina]USG60957.1 hypothetical protein NBZ79_17505 [Sneathiella marina]
MYILRTQNCRKKDLEKRWALPDRVFFACGACQVLAHVFMEKNAPADAQAIWIKPSAGHTGNHIIVSFADRVFDYHGYTEKNRFLAHYWKRARQVYPGWDAELVDITQDALTTEGPSAIYDGLWLRAPHQFFKNPLPRAEAFLAKVPKHMKIV